jgi:hypothetical protein
MGAVCIVSKGDAILDPKHPVVVVEREITVAERAIGATKAMTSVLKFLMLFSGAADVVRDPRRNYYAPNMLAKSMKIRALCVINIAGMSVRKVIVAGPTKDKFPAVAKPR